MRLVGTYFTRGPGGERIVLARNLVPTQGREYFLNAGIKGTGGTTNFYIAIFSGAVTPVDGWTAANFTANSSEIVSDVEGYTGAVRPAWTHGAVAAGVVGNAAALAQYNIVATGSINIEGAALLTSATRGGTAGVLISAARFPSPYTIANGATYDLGYELELVDGD